MSSHSKGEALAYANDLHLNPPWYRKPWFLATVLGAAMLLVVVSIFTATSLARDVSRLAQASHSTNEALRVASVVQTEFVSADGFRSLGPDFDSAAVIDTSAGVSAAGLTNLLSVLDEPSLSPESRQELETYLDAAQVHLADPTGDMNLDAVTAAFERLSTSLTAERSALVDELERVNMRMNGVATAAGFAIAFFVPAAGLYVWEALRRSSGRQLMLERELTQLRAESQMTSGELAATVKSLKKQTVGHLESITSGDRTASLRECQELVRVVDRLDSELAARSSLQTIVREPVRLVDLVRTSVNSAMVPTLRVPSRSELYPGLIVVVDVVQMRGALIDLIRMVALTSSDLHLDVVTTKTAATVQLKHSGTNGTREESVVEPVSHSGETRPLGNPDTTSDRKQLDSIRRQFATAGGNLVFESGPQISTYSVTMPIGADARAESDRPNQAEPVGQ